MSVLDRLDSFLLQGALQIARTLRDHGHQALFAGGIARDLLLGHPVTDVDIAVSATPDEIEGLFEHTVAVGKRFGVMIVVLEGRNYEITTFRREGEYRDGRHPSRVEFSEARDDALRRDFTVNGMFVEPFSGEVIDYVGGRSDLQAGIIRTIGPASERFEEDKLRILRAIRFACRLGFKIEDATYRALAAYAPQLTQVSWERIRDELLKILTGTQPARGIRLLHDTGILHIILPEVAAMDGVPQPPQFHPEGDVLTHTRLMFEKSVAPDPTLAMGILLHDVGKPPTFKVKERIRFDGHAELGAEMADKISRRLKLSNQQREEIVDLVRQHLRFIHVREMRPSTLKRFLRQEHFEKHLELHRLDCLASHGDLSNWEFCRRKLEELRAQPVRPRPLLSGHDLIRLGYTPGPIFSRILTAVEDQQLEGTLRTREETLKWVKEKFGEPRTDQD